MYENKIRVNLVSQWTVSKGESKPSWRADIKAGRDATTQLLGSKYIVKSWNPMFVEYYHSNGKISSQVLGFDQVTFPTVTHTASARAHSYATSNFAKKFRQKTTNWSGGVFLGELRETAAFLRRPAKGLYDLTNGLTRKVRGLAPMWNFHKRQQYADALADTWLAYQFAARPLIRDANDASLALEALRVGGRNFDIIRLSAFAADEEDLGWNDSNLGVVPGIGGSIQQRVNQVQTSIVTIRGAWKSDTPGGEIPVPMQFGLSTLDIVPTVWELIPWSFLVDYFTNVGDCLNAYPLRYVDWAWLNSTVRVERVRTGYPVYKPAGVSAKSIHRGGNFVLKSTGVMRTRITGDYLQTGLFLEAPGFKSLKWLNIAALANNILLSRPP